MERAELAVGSIEVRGSSAIHRLLNYLGAVLLGIGPAARTQEDQNWWDREAPAPGADTDVPITFGHQAELFDDAGQAAASARPVAAPPVAPPAAQTIVSVQARSRSTARVVATTRVVPAVRVSAVARAATPARGVVARQLVLSQSISSGKEEARWFSVPQRALLPRFQLFEGADAVTEEDGRLCIGSPSGRAQPGQVWFV